jgi:hypothetical protein
VPGASAPATFELDVFDLPTNKNNARAIRFCETYGFRCSGEDVNPTFGKPV